MMGRPVRPGAWSAPVRVGGGGAEGLVEVQDGVLVHREHDHHPAAGER